MAEDKSFNLNSLTQHYSIQEITAIFSDIDTRIMSMHESSSRDFQMFNQQMRDFNTIAKQISENLQAIFDLTSDPQSRDKLQDFSKHYDQLQDNIGSMNTALVDIKDNGETTLSYLQKIPLVLKNFNQDLMTLKFTLANLKLNFSDYFGKGNQDITGLTQEVEDLTQHLKTDLPGLLKNARSSTDLLEQLIGSILENSFDRINTSSNILKQINENVSELIGKNEKIGKALPEIQTHIQKSFNDLDKIVTKIQYHDIIKQKMEHIQATHKELIKELTNLESDKKNQIILFRQAKYASQLPYIAELQIAQLVYTNKEYQNTLETITQTFDDIKKHMSISTDLTHKLRQDESYNVGANYEVAKKELNQTTEVIYQLKKNYLDIIQISDLIKKRLKDLQEHIKQMKKLDSKLQELSDKLSEQIYNELADKNLAKIGMDIKNLAHDLSNNMNNCRLYLNYACRFSEDIGNKLEVINNKEDINISQDLSAKADELLEMATGRNEEIHKRLDENEQNSKTAHEKLKNTIDKINYYDFFEGSMESVIFELNNIYENLHQQRPDLSNLDKNEKLKRIKDFYTTKSERDIHNDILSGKGRESSPDEDQEQNQSEGEDDNIEFF